ncbi:protein of unknown function [Cupriavidus taiwanensis]|uniref:Uncharacterized protein n=1 Tax=Cupriavidus taiwanensis TaxID=164546 RepID=A0A9Q7XRY4_9BURK|nr:protein of unknown function [Cupriavidus taiwanensis]
MSLPGAATVRWHPDLPDPPHIRAPGRRGRHTAQPAQGPFHRPPLRSSNDWIEQTSVPLDATFRVPPLGRPGQPGPATARFASPEPLAAWPG